MMDYRGLKRGGGRSSDGSHNGSRRCRRLRKKVGIKENERVTSSREKERMSRLSSRKKRRRKKRSMTLVDSDEESSCTSFSNSSLLSRSERRRTNSHISAKIASEAANYRRGGNCNRNLSRPSLDGDSHSSCGEEPYVSPRQIKPKYATSDSESAIDNGTSRVRVGTVALGELGSLVDTSESESNQPSLRRRIALLGEDERIRSTVSTPKTESSPKRRSILPISRVAVSSSCKRRGGAPIRRRRRPNATPIKVGRTTPSSRRTEAPLPPPRIERVETDPRPRTTTTTSGSSGSDEPSASSDSDELLRRLARIAVRRSPDPKDRTGTGRGTADAAPNRGKNDGETTGGAAPSGGRLAFFRPAFYRATPPADATVWDPVVVPERKKEVGGSSTEGGRDAPPSKVRRETVDRDYRLTFPSSSSGSCGGEETEISVNSGSETSAAVSSEDVGRASAYPLSGRSRRDRVRDRIFQDPRADATATDGTSTAPRPKPEKHDRNHGRERHGTRRPTGTTDNDNAGLPVPRRLDRSHDGDDSRSIPQTKPPAESRRTAPPSSSSGTERESFVTKGRRPTIQTKDMASTKSLQKVGRHDRSPAIDGSAKSVTKNRCNDIPLNIRFRLSGGDEDSSYGDSRRRIPQTEPPAESRQTPLLFSSSSEGESFVTKGDGSELQSKDTPPSKTRIQTRRSYDQSRKVDSNGTYKSDDSPSYPHHMRFELTGSEEESRILATDKINPATSNQSDHAGVRRGSFGQSGSKDKPPAYSRQSALPLPNREYEFGVLQKAKQNNSRNSKKRSNNSPPPYTQRSLLVKTPLKIYSRRR